MLQTNTEKYIVEQRVKHAILSFKKGIRTLCDNTNLLCSFAAEAPQQNS